jgi:hypothetical protein
MPQIIVTADRGTDRGEGAVMLRERISSSDFESATFAARLVERLGWAVDDAHAVEEAADADAPTVTGDQSEMGDNAPGGGAGDHRLDLDRDLAHSAPSA